MQSEIKLYPPKGKSPFWQYSFTKNGQRVRKSSRERNKERAYKVAQQHYNDIEHNRMTVYNAYERYFNEHIKHLPTCKTVMGRVAVFLSYFNGYYLDEIDDASLKVFISKLRTTNTRFKRPYTNATINRIMAAFQSLYRVAKDTWLVKVAPINFKVHKLLEREKMDVVITPEQYQAMLEISPIWLRQQIIFLYNTCVRHSNMATLDWSKVDLPNRVITIITKSKRPERKQLRVPVNNTVFNLLTEMGVQPTGKVFQYKNSKKALERVLKQAGVELPKGILWHAFRHTGISNLINAGNDVVVVKEIAGHSSISTTERYIKVKHETKVDAVNKLVGGGDAK